MGMPQENLWILKDKELRKLSLALKELDSVNFNFKKFDSFGPSYDSERIITFFTYNRYLNHSIRESFIIVINHTSRIPEEQKL